MIPKIPLFTLANVIFLALFLSKQHFKIYVTYFGTGISTVKMVAKYEIFPFYRKNPYPGSKLWIDKLLQMLGQGLEVNFDILIKNIEPFLICPSSLAGIY